MDKFLNIYTKYPWVAVVIVVHWVVTAFMIIDAPDIDVAMVMGIAFFATVIYAYFGFKIPKG